jgi:hypothetical protein
MRRLCTDYIEKAELQLRSAIILVNSKGFEVEDSTLGSDQDLTLMDAGHKAVLRRLDTIVYLSQSLHQMILPCYSAIGNH